jgi:hypothetical protein
VCSEKINAARQAELETGISNWLDAGHAVVFGTLTMRHHKGQRLADLWDAVSPAWNRTTSGAGVAWNGSKRRGGDIGDKARFGIREYLRVVEVKLGDNGWHPHIHFLLFLESELSGAELRDLESRMFARWEAALARKGYSVVREVGIDLRPVAAGERNGISDYLTKNTYASTPGAAAYEVTGSQSKRQGKGGVTPFQLLERLVALGDADDLDAWHEWEVASAGRRQMTWSRGARQLLGLDQELSDEELAEAEFDGEPVLTFTAQDWYDGGWCQVRAELLEHAELGTIAAYVSRRWSAAQGPPDGPSADPG